MSLCQQLRPYLDGEASPLQQWRMRRHLRRCPACSGQKAAEEELLAALRREAETPGPGEEAAAERVTRGWLAALEQVKRAIQSGVTSVSDLKRLASDQIPPDARVRLEYFEIVDPVDFQPVEHVTGPVVAAGALWVGTTRLIDNIRI